MHSSIPAASVLVLGAMGFHGLAPAWEHASPYAAPAKHADGMTSDRCK